MLWGFFKAPGVQRHVFEYVAVGGASPTLDVVGRLALVTVYRNNLDRGQIDKKRLRIRPIDTIMPRSIYQERITRSVFPVGRTVGEIRSTVQKPSHIAG